jgi:transcriptional regulator with PAS, ATPase and Fis domain
MGHVHYMSAIETEEQMLEGESDLLKVLEEVLKGYGLSPTIARAIRFFFRNPYESLVIANNDGKLEFLDRGSEKSFGFPEGGAKGVAITDLIRDSAIPRVLETGTPIIGRVFDVKGISNIGSTYPLIKDGEIVGAIGRLIFRSLEEVERINTEIGRLRKEVKFLRERQRHQHCALYTFGNILGISKAIKSVIEMSKKVAFIDTDVLIVGESGTGKELFAQAIHNYVNSEKPFVRVNSSAIPYELAESVLFGYEKGAFSGACASGKPGKFELAHNGSIFLDEIGSLPLFIQPKLLRVLQEREFERLGSTQIQEVNFRLIAATSEDLRKMVREGKFRQDLYYRIDKATIRIPPLRERRDDIPVYITHFLKAINERFGTRIQRFSDEALYYFMNYDWPGNVRELVNVIEQSCLRKWEGEEVPSSCLPPEFLGSPSLHVPATIFPSTLRGLKGKITPGFKRQNVQEEEEEERRLILEALGRTHGNKRQAAFSLGIPRSTLYKKLKNYSIGV